MNHSFGDVHQFSLGSVLYLDFVQPWEHGGLWELFLNLLEVSASDWIISITNLVSSGYLKYDRFSVFFICKYFPEDNGHVNIAKIITCSGTSCCNPTCGYTAITMCPWQNKSQIKRKQKPHPN